MLCIRPIGDVGEDLVPEKDWSHIVKIKHTLLHKSLYMGTSVTFSSNTALQSQQVLDSGELYFSLFAIILCIHPVNDVREDITWNKLGRFRYTFNDVHM